jgi:predicted phosphodiesterase
MSPSRRHLLSGFLPALSAPWPGPLRVTVISDMNGHYGSTRYEPAVARAISRIRELKPGLVLSLGDAIAGQQRHPRLSRPQLESMWRAFHAVVTDPLGDAGIGLAVIAGNHDASAYPGFELERLIFREQWTPRRPRLDYVGPPDDPFQYAFALGGVLFLGLDGTTAAPATAKAKAWLSQLLARHGAGYRWRVVFTHVPLFPFVRQDERETVNDPELEAVLRNGRVDLVLSGHHHAFYPGVENGILWLSHPCLGAGPRRLNGATHVSPRGFTLLEFPEHGPLKIQALAEPGLHEAIDLRTLPPSLRTSRRVLTRFDLAPRLH